MQLPVVFRLLLVVVNLLLLWRKANRLDPWHFNVWNFAQPSAPLFLEVFEFSFRLWRPCDLLYDTHSMNLVVAIVTTIVGPAAFNYDEISRLYLTSSWVG